MTRRIFNILAAVSLVLCLTLAASLAVSDAPCCLAWMTKQEMHRQFLQMTERPGVRIGVMPGAVKVCSVSVRDLEGPTERHESRSLTRWRCVGLELSYVVRGANGMWDPDEVRPMVVLTDLTIPLWMLCPLTAILPAVWLRRYRRDRRLRTDGMPHCTQCDYNLTGNVRGICPECGTPIVAQAREEEINRELRG